MLTIKLLLEFLVPLLQSIFCLQGYDERSRFFVLSGISLLAFILFSAIFASYFVVNLLFLLLLTSILTLTTIRRLRDAKLSKSWQLIPSVLFLITGVITLLLDNNISYYLLLLPSLVSALLLTYPSQNDGKEKNYIYGYYGPVDLASYLQSTKKPRKQNQRIEPTLASDSVNTHAVNHASIATQVEQNNNNQTDQQSTSQIQADLGELIRLKLLNNKRLQLGIVISLLAIFVTIVITSLLTSNTKSTQLHEAEQNLSQEQIIQQSNISGSKLIASRTQHLVMPDNFDLYLTPYKGILLHWQADSVATGQLWSQLTTKGDKSCQLINFNQGNDLRPLTIMVENNTEYFASFSPLDTQALIQALAFQGSFSLCGYDFSLKGSQAVLGKHNSYAFFLDK